ncbi:hypothetical protein GJAV_G00014660, partial [Gymnothorax javanicus]
SHVPQGLHQPAATFPGDQASVSLLINAEATRLTSVPRSNVKPNGFSHSLGQLESSTSKNLRRSKKGTGSPTCVFDDFPSSRDAGNRDAGIEAEALLSHNFASPVNEPSMGSEQPLLCLASNEPVKVVPAAIKVTQERAKSLSGPCHLSSDGVTAGHDSENHSPLSASAEKSVDRSLSSGSDLPLPLNEDKDLGRFCGDPAHSSASNFKPSQPGGIAERIDEPTMDAGYCNTSAHKESKHAVESKDEQESPHGKMQLASDETSPMLSLEGFFHLLESIEERLAEGEKKMYRISSVSEPHLSCLISLCNRKADLNEEDLEACGALALHQLQRLSWSMSKGCLLPQEVVCDNWTEVAEESRVRSCLSTIGTKLWERWFRHALILRDCGAFTVQGIAKLFAPLLVAKGAFYTDKAEALLNVLLLGEDAVDSDESSGCLPLPFFDDGESRAARPACSHKNFLNGQQSGEEDSQEESFVESIPIRETKAYQLLKQSAALHQPQSPQEDEDELDVFQSGGTSDSHVENPVKDENTQMSSFSFSERPLVGAGNVEKRSVPAVKSKAFWGESDDSNNE